MEQGVGEIVLKSWEKTATEEHIVAKNPQIKL